MGAPDTNWLSVAFELDADHVEAFSDALIDRGALSVSVEDADAGTATEQPQFGEPGSDAPAWPHSRVIALFPAATDVAAAAKAATAAGGLAEVPAYSVSEVAEQNWVELSRSQFEPIRINERLWIVPSWHTAPDPRATNLIVDPGMAFGTGSHPTTRLCLEWLCDQVREGDSVLDYGCGSGILAIAAARLGARAVTGVDIDTQALRAAGDNAERNRVRVSLRHSNEHFDDRFDIVVANILANPLCLLAPLLASRTRRGGALALSGILEPQAAQVREAYRDSFALDAAASLDGWVLMTGVRR